MAVRFCEDSDLLLGFFFTGEPSPFLILVCSTGAVAYLESLDYGLFSGEFYSSFMVFA
jgi:hypothetical protein